MAHDFAKKRSSKTTSKRSSNKKIASKGKANSTHWSWFVTGSFFGIFLAFAIDYFLIKPGNINIPLPSLDTDIVIAPEETPEAEFDFYVTLAESEVQVDVELVEIISEVGAAAVVPTKYLLQAGSFQSRQDAENRLAKVILLNLDASIVPGVVSGKTWHRVQAGPFAGRSKAEDARDVLSSNNIDTIVLQAR